MHGSWSPVIARKALLFGVNRDVSADASGPALASASWSFSGISHESPTLRTLFQFASPDSAAR